MSDECNRPHTNFGVELAMLLVMTFLSFCFGLYCMDESWKKNTVKEGRARWVVINEEGSTKWEWIPK